MFVMGYSNPSKISGGLAPNFYYISKYEAEMGHEIVIFTNGTHRYKEIVEGIPVWHVPVRRVRRWTFGYDIFREMYSSGFKPDIIHSMNPMPFGWQFRAYKDMIDAKYVLSVHTPTIRFGFDFANLRLMEFSLLLDFLTREVDLVLAVSDYNAKGLLSRGTPPHKLRIVPSGIDTNIFHPRDEEEKEIFDVLFVGRFAPVKRVCDIIKAADILRSEGIKDIRYTLVGGSQGDGNYSKVVSMISKRRLTRSFRIIPPVNQSILPSYYWMSDIFVLPSIYEALGKVLLESMACGTPVITPSSGGAGQLTKDSRSGITYQPGSPSSLASAIREMSREDRKRNCLGRIGRRYALRYDWKHIAENYLNVFGELISNESE